MQLILTIGFIKFNVFLKSLLHGKPIVLINSHGEFVVFKVPSKYVYFLLFSLYNFYSAPSCNNCKLMQILILNHKYKLVFLFYTILYHTQYLIYPVQCKAESGLIWLLMGNKNFKNNSENVRTPHFSINVLKTLYLLFTH